MYIDNDEEFPAEKYLEHGKDNGLAHQHGSSSIPLSTNGFLQEKNKTKQNFQDTTARTRRQQDTQRRTQCHIPSKRKHSSSMELGSEFTHVSLDEAIDAKEKLVRERFNCKTIGDAYALG
ncbi:hypothetical protein BRADI_1g26230v3 [Brachypodium distachyon]|uniref:Uncharacterized protein n=1 Tax=Brachypodium distachyon TaxID=15368 RepID=A0A2K2DL53_BRADI|nr:hypothetical protein BRADI_1g26230v3 [Brachypodium distachyon]